MAVGASVSPPSLPIRPSKGLNAVRSRTASAAANLVHQIVQGDGLVNYVRLGSGLSIQEMAVPREWEGEPSG